MKRNACGIDRILRFVGGTALAILATFVLGSDREDDVSVGQVVAMYLAAELFVTGLLRWCPMNSLLGRNTCSRT